MEARPAWNAGGRIARQRFESVHLRKAPFPFPFPFPPVPVAP